MADDAAEADRAGQLWMERVADIVLSELAGAPAGDVEVPIVQAEVNVRHQRRHGAEGLQRGRQQVCAGWLSGNLDDLLRLPRAVCAAPDPDRRRQVFER